LDEARTDSGPAEEAASAAPEGSGFEVRLQLFEGPLDLLLHLVRANDMDIFDLPIAEVARQYGSYLELMREMDLDVAGDYLVMAATLAHIKSRLLLPVESDPEAGEEDPRAELTRQLLEYERFKQAAESLSALESVRSLVFTRPEGPLPEYRGEATLEVGLFDLLRAFRDLLEEQGKEREIRVTRERFAVADKVNWLVEVLERDGPQSFRELILTFPSRAERIVTFLAILELVRLQLIVAHQARTRGDIHLARREEPAADPEEHP
jgi:segregation and condensation protein A